MSIERERKFLVKRLPKEYLNYRPEKIIQAYLVLTDDIQLRLRIYDHAVFAKDADLTFKQTINNTDRIEIEYTIDINEALNTIKEKKYLCLLTKERYFLEGWDIDIYPNGLTVAEYEFSDENPFPETLPDWVGEEVTGVKEYSNIYIAQNFEKFS